MQFNFSTPVYHPGLKPPLRTRFNDLMPGDPYNGRANYARQMPQAARGVVARAAEDVNLFSGRISDYRQTFAAPSRVMMNDPRLWTYLGELP